MGNGNSNSNVELVRRFMKTLTPEKLARLPDSKKKIMLERATKVLENIGKNKLANYNKVKVHKKQIIFHKSPKRKRLMLGGNRCISGASMIYDPVQDKHLRVDEIHDTFHVYAWDFKANKKVIAQALPPYHHEDVDQLYDVLLSDGRQFTCSRNHMFLSADGLWLPLSRYQPGCELFLPPTSSGCDPLVRDEDALHSMQKAEDCQSDYHPSHHLCDEQLLCRSKNGQDASPSLEYVRGHRIYEAFLNEDGSDNIPSHIRLDLYSDLLSSLDGQDPNEDQCVGYVCRVCGKVSRRTDCCNSTALQSICECGAQLQPIYGAELSVLLLDGISPLPYMLPPSDVVAISSITPSSVDYKWDFTVPVYANYIMEGIVHHNTGKTVSGAVECVWWARGNHPYREIPRATDGWVVSVTNEVQRDVAQKEVLKWLNPDWIVDIGVRDGSKSDMENAILEYILVRSEKGGISKIGFKSCEQGRRKFQGTSKDYIWFDEEPDKDIYDECLMRIMDVQGSIWLTMTPLMGLTFIHDLLYLNERNDPEVVAFQMSWEDNPFLSPAEIEQMVIAMSEEEREARQKGNFVALTGLIYPEYDPDWHVLKGEYDFKDKTIYLIDDDGVRYSKIYHRWYDKFSVDVGYNNPTSVHFYAQDDEGSVYCLAEHYESKKTVSYHADCIKRIARALNWPKVNGGYAGIVDTAANQKTAASDESAKEKYTRNGIYLSDVDKSVFDGIMTVKEYLKFKPYFDTEVWPKGKPKFFLLRVENWPYDNSNMDREFKKYRWAEQRQDANDKEQPKKKDDHAMDELRYYLHNKPGTTLYMNHMETLNVNQGNMSDLEKQDMGIAPLDTNQPFRPGRRNDDTHKLANSRHDGRNLHDRSGNRFQGQGAANIREQLRQHTGSYGGRRTNSSR